MSDRMFRDLLSDLTGTHDGNVIHAAEDIEQLIDVLSRSQLKRLVLVLMFTIKKQLDPRYIPAMNSSRRHGVTVKVVKVKRRNQNFIF